MTIVGAIDIINAKGQIAIIVTFMTGLVDKTFSFSKFYVMKCKEGFE